MILRVGQSPSALSIAKYGKHLDLMEVRLDNGAPRKRTLEAMKSESPAQMAFAVLVPKQVSALESDATEADVTPTLDTARGLSARFIVVRTPPTARPGARTRARLTRLVELLKAAEIDVVWEPSGLLAEAEAEAVAAELGVTLARDPARDDLPEGEVAYGRISSLGTGGRVRGSAIERAADRLSAFEEAYVVIEGDNALQAAKDLRSLLGADAPGGAATLDDEEDEDFEDEDEDDFEDEDEDE
ncbi:MAG TPA: hypothetical protein VHB79_13205 [Polyangiaceae bacterium]|nr:hypothetical protein [Polyangiaceae bacterium]